MHYFMGYIKCVIYNLQKVQNSAARTLTGTPRREHITPVHQDLHWLPVRCRVIFKIKVKNCIAPAYLSELVEHYKPGRMLHSSSLDDHKFVELPTSLVTGGDQALKAGPVLWNKLPLHIQSAKSLISFKRSLKTTLFSLDCIILIVV